MDQLPELRSDADVDAMMARLRAKLVPVPASSPDVPRPAATPDNPLRDLFTLQKELTTTVTRALRLMIDALDDLAADDDTRAAAGAKRSVRMPGPAPAPRLKAYANEGSRRLRTGQKSGKRKTAKSRRGTSR